MSCRLSNTHKLFTCALADAEYLIQSWVKMCVGGWGMYDFVVPCFRRFQSQSKWQDKERFPYFKQSQASKHWCRWQSLWKRRAMSLSKEENNWSAPSSRCNPNFLPNNMHCTGILKSMFVDELCKTMFYPGLTWWYTGSDTQNFFQRRSATV